MKLLRIHLQHFGKLQPQTFELEDGIHIISGNNESGKSTLHAFIKAIFFDIERGRGRGAKNDGYHRHLPWEGGAYGGVIELEKEEELFSLSRRFDPKSSSTRLVNLTSGKEIPPTGENFSRLFSGLTPSLFQNTLSIRQLMAKTGEDLAEELQNHMVNLQTSGSTDFDVIQALEWLKKEKKRQEKLLVKNIRQEAVDLDQRIFSLEQELLSSPQEDIQRWEKERTLIEEKLHQAAEIEPSPQIQQSAKKKQQKKSFFLLGGIILLLFSFLFLLLKKFLFFALLFVPALFCLMISQQVKRILSWEEENRLREKQKKYQDLSQAHKDMQSRLEILHREAWRKEQQEDQLRTFYQQRDRLTELLKKNQQIQEEIDCFSLAMETLENLSSQFFTDFGTFLTENVSRIFCGITQGAYDCVYLDENLNLFLKQGHRLVDPLQVSTGTLEQLYLSLRLACIEFLWLEESMPLFLDDTFAFYDDVRLSHTLEWLAENYSGQIFLFTCHQREELLFRQKNIPFSTLSL